MSLKSPSVDKLATKSLDDDLNGQGVTKTVRDLTVLFKEDFLLARDIVKETSFLKKKKFAIVKHKKTSFVKHYTCVFKSASKVYF